MLFIMFMLFLLILLVAMNVRIVPQASVYVIERLGTYLCTWGAGLHIKLPFIDRIANKVSIKEQVVDFAPHNGTVDVLHDVVSPFSWSEPVRTIQESRFVDFR